jgi:hypothetical protein
MVEILGEKQPWFKWGFPPRFAVAMDHVDLSDLTIKTPGTS